MFVSISLLISILLLAFSASYLLQQKASEDLFAGGLAVVGVVVMVLTLLFYPLTRRA